MNEEQKFDEVLENNEQKQKVIEQPQPVKVNGNKGKPKSEAWKQAQRERMIKIHAEKKANKEQIKQ